MNSLKIKFLGLCCIILMVSVGLTTWYNLQTQKAMLHKMASEHGRMLAETIRNSIITDMANGKNDRVGHILGKINSEPAIENVRIFDGVDYSYTRGENRKALNADCLKYRDHGLSNDKSFYDYRNNTEGPPPARAFVQFVVQ